MDAYTWLLRFHGGFAIHLDTANNPHALLFGNNKRLTLTTKAFALIAKYKDLPEISADDIKDKNKADGLTKLLVCIQAR